MGQSLGTPLPKIENRQMDHTGTTEGSSSDILWGSGKVSPETWSSTRFPYLGIVLT